VTKGQRFAVCLGFAVVLVAISAALVEALRVFGYSSVAIGVMILTIAVIANVVPRLWRRHA
jgi:hypothetical protein